MIDRADNGFHEHPAFLVLQSVLSIIGIIVAHATIIVLSEKNRYTVADQKELQPSR